MTAFAAIATTPSGLHTLLPLQHSLPATLWAPASLATTLEAHSGATVQFYQGALRDTLAELWTSQDGLIFALATGAVVRLIAPLLSDKAKDPAVVVVDESGQFAISLCGG
ncbi:MAG: precorrin-3B C(17)-methyltransferase, partial [Cyanobacteria bacterium P01_H01_bin.58]